MDDYIFKVFTRNLSCSINFHIINVVSMVKVRIYDTSLCSYKKIEKNNPVKVRLDMGEKPDGRKKNFNATLICMVH